MRDVEIFRGFTNYFRTYNREYSVVSDAISDLRRRNVPFIWSEECERQDAYLTIIRTGRMPIYGFFGSYLIIISPLP